MESEGVNWTNNNEIQIFFQTIFKFLPQNFYNGDDSSSKPFAHLNHTHHSFYPFVGEMDFVFNK